MSEKDDKEIEAEAEDKQKKVSIKLSQDIELKERKEE
jgi:hypothetical protein